MKNEHFGEELFAPGVARLTRHERRPPPNPNVLPQTSFRHATIGAGHRHNPCGCGFRQVRRRAPWLLTSWRRGGAGWLTAYPTSVLLQEGNGHLLGASHGAATSSPPLREDPQLWWPRDRSAWSSKGRSVSCVKVDSSLHPAWCAPSREVKPIGTSCRLQNVPPALSMQRE
jgi:hypothetical protein